MAASMKTGTQESIDQSLLRPALTREFRLGAWQVQPARNRLQHRNGRLSRHLEPRLMHLLCFLAANEQRVLSRDELVQELWPRVIVNENSLTRAMSELRKRLTLAEQSGTGWIETIAKKGYRLLPPVQPGNAPERPPAPVFSVTRPLTLGLAGAVFTALGFIGAALWWQPAPLTGVESSGVDQPADEVMNPEREFFGAELTLSSTVDADSAGRQCIDSLVVSRSGQYFACLDHAPGGSTIYLGSFSDLKEPAPVFNSPRRLFNLTWSPLGDSLIFARQSALSSALPGSETATAPQLYSLDLDSLTLHRLVETPVARETTAELRLT